MNNKNEEAPKLIEIPDHLLPESLRDRSTCAALGAEAAKAADESLDGRSGLGKVEVPMPADPSKVPGWNGDVRR